MVRITCAQVPRTGCLFWVVAIGTVVYGKRCMAVIVGGIQMTCMEPFGKPLYRIRPLFGIGKRLTGVGVSRKTGTPVRHILIQKYVRRWAV